MKILSAPQIRAWDTATIATQSIPPAALMERAARACTDWISRRYSPETPFVIVCGTGNNGGDGLALTRMLIEGGYSAAAFMVMHTTRLAPYCAANLRLLENVQGSPVRRLGDGDFITELPATAVLIDALFGTGINRPVEGYAADFIRHLNERPGTKISIDLPSGLPPDGLPDEHAAIVCAQHTLCFEQYKRGMLHPEGGRYCREVSLLSIGLDEEYLQSAETDWHTLDKFLVKACWRKRAAFSHKGTLGTAFLIGGAYGFIGSMALATQAAGKAGAGKVRALVPECGYNIIQSLVPEAMCATSGAHCLESIEGWESANGIGIGPGLGSEAATVAAFSAFLKKVAQPIVLDADALNMLGAHPDLLALVPQDSILTPHPKELDRLFGKTADSFARVDLARRKAMEHQVIIISKDRYTVIALPDGRCYYNIFGNAGMATGGSGDVLCGILAGLLAQGYAPERAAMLGVYLHAAAGDAAAAKTGMEAMVAPDIVAHIGAAFFSLQ